jgi:general secretion pathway protein I
MIHPRSKPNRRRPGLSLLEVLVALAIFLFSMVTISKIVIAAADRAVEARYHSEGVQICQQLLARLSIGELSMSSQGDTPLDQDPEWHWSVDAEQGTVSGLWNVTVHASRAGPTGSPMEYCSLSEMLLDPSMRGSSFDTVTVNGTSSSNTGSGSGTGSSSGTGSGSGGGTGATKSKPAASSPTPSTSSPTRGGM